jgi:hypothetical protein
VERWWNVTDGGTEVWSVGGMLLTGEQKCGGLNGSDRKTEALVEWY